jgi:nitroimidazol reductase NimA-like FMN-containing flavoprotein (pyridoxamine 5'-phosphate oxidase superfamily)
MQASIVRTSSAWDLAQIEAFLGSSLIPVRLACLSRADEPLICSLWFCYDEGAIWCATQGGAHVAAMLERNPSCAFEVAGDSMPYSGVRGQGRVSISKTDGADVLLRLIDRYLGSRETDFARWLVARQANEVSIRIDPEWVTSWDFGARRG